MTKTKGTTAGMKSRGATKHVLGVRAKNVSVAATNALKPGLATAAPKPAVTSKPVDAPMLATAKKSMFPIGGK